MKGKIVYIAGAVTGIKDYRKRFGAAENFLTDIGTVVLNPSVLPEGLSSHDSYMRITLAMLAEAEVVAFLPCWLGSKGARMEHLRAVELGLECWELEADTIDGELVCVGLKPMPVLDDQRNQDLAALHQVIERTKTVWSANGS